MFSGTREVWIRRENSHIEDHRRTRRDRTRSITVLGVMVQPHGPFRTVTQTVRITTHQLETNVILPLPTQHFCLA